MRISSLMARLTRREQRTAKQRQQSRSLEQGQTHHPRIAALEIGNELRTTPLDRVGAGLVGRFARSPVRRNFPARDGAKRNLAVIQLHALALPSVTATAVQTAWVRPASRASIRAASA